MSDKHVFADFSWLDVQGDYKIVNVVLSLENIKELIRGENVEVINLEQFGNTAIVIKIDDQDKFRENLIR